MAYVYVAWPRLKQPIEQSIYYQSICIEMLLKLFGGKKKMAALNDWKVSNPNYGKEN